MKNDMEETLEKIKIADKVKKSRLKTDIVCESFNHKRKKERQQDGIKIKIEEVNKFEVNGQTGVEVFAKVWKDGKQCGFGTDGSVEIERFKIYNPPVLIEKEDGEILQEWESKLSGEKRSRRLSYNPEQALYSAIIDTVKVMKNCFTDTNIVKGKRGNTTSTFYSTVGDGYCITSTSGDSWATAHDKTSASFDYTATTMDAVCDALAGAGGIRNTRMFFSFDTSAIGTDNVQSATFSLYFKGYAGAGHATRTMYLIKTTQSSTSTLEANDYDNVDTIHPMVTAGSVSMPSSGGTGVYKDFTINPDYRSWINRTGHTKLGVVYDADALATTGHSNAPSSTQSHREFYTSDQTGTSNDPKLVVEHTASPICDYLIIAGGGAGGNGDAGGGGGGAGGYIKKTGQIITAGNYTVTVGAGGSGVSSAVSNNGSDSSFNGDTAIGGGMGDSEWNASGSGGSGGGSNYQTGATGGAGTSGQGNAGGSRTGSQQSPFAGSGGGGSGAVGGNSVTTVAGAGGAGTADSITGTSVTRAGGGGGGRRTGGSGGAGGSGGGGAGASSTGASGTSGTANTGSGGGASSNNGTSGSGGSGVVIVRLLTSDWGSITGGTQTTDGSYTVVTFTSSGTLGLTASGGGATFIPKVVFIN